MALKPKPNAPQPRRKSKVVKVNTRYLDFIAGKLTVDDLDEEEIMRGQLRNATGDFRGRPPNMVPREFAQAIAAKQQELIKKKLGGQVLQALKTLDEVMTRQNPQPGDNARVNAAKLVLEYNIGKVPDKVEIKAEIETWERTMEEVVVKYDDVEDADIVDGNDE